MGGTAGTNILGRIAVMIKCTGGCYNVSSPPGWVSFCCFLAVVWLPWDNLVGFNYFNPRYIGYFGLFSGLKINVNDLNILFLRF